MNDLPLFDYAESIRHRDAGIAVAADNNATLLTEARQIARELGRNGREVSADDVMEEWVSRGGGIHDFGNSMGALFQTQDWKVTGRIIKSKRIGAHGNLLRTWLYIGK